MTSQGFNELFWQPHTHLVHLVSWQDSVFTHIEARSVYVITETNVDFECEPDNVSSNPWQDSNLHYEVHELTNHALFHQITGTDTPASSSPFSIVVHYIHNRAWSVLMSTNTISSDVFLVLRYLSLSVDIFLTFICPLKLQSPWLV